MLKDLEADVETFRAEKKFEAAERLEQQLSLLKVWIFLVQFPIFNFQCEVTGYSCVLSTVGIIIYFLSVQ